MEGGGIVVNNDPVHFDEVPTDSKAFMDKVSDAPACVTAGWGEGLLRCRRVCREKVYSPGVIFHLRLLCLVIQLLVISTDNKTRKTCPMFIPEQRANV